MDRPDRSVAIFTSRESPALLARTLDAVIAACAARRTTIDVLVDGNDATARALAEGPVVPPDGITVRLWRLEWRDKACAWNRWVHELSPDAATAFFVDGYVRPAPDAFAALERALAADPHARAATGVPTVGPSAARQRRTLVADGGLHGNLYALRGEALARLKRAGFRLPLGLYRNDSLIGAVMAFAGDPARHDWDPRRIAVVADATWDNDVAPLFAVGRLRAYRMRRRRQAQGALENAAVRDHLAIRKRAPETLPPTVGELVAAGPADTIARAPWFDRPRLRAAARRLAEPVDWSRCDAPPDLLRTWGAR